MRAGYRRQQGFAILTYVLVAVALIGIATAVEVLSANNSIVTDRQWAVTGQIVAQANLLRQKLLDCAGQGGNNATSNHPAYPVGTNAAVSGLTCPASAASVFSGTDGVFLPPAPPGFNSWTYTNDATSVRLLLQVTSAGNVASLTPVLNRAVANFGAIASGGAAAVITTVATGDTFELIVSN